MRAALLVASVLAASALAGCFRYIDVIGCDGEADWTEPGISEWLHVNGFQAGFGPPLNASGAIRPLLPNGTMLMLAYRQTQVASMTATLVVRGSDALLHASQFAGDRTGAIAALAAYADETLAQVHRGDPASRAAALDKVRNDDWLLRDEESTISFELENSWAFDSMLGRNHSFTEAEDGSSHELDAGQWHFTAVIPTWSMDWETRPSLPHLTTLGVNGRDAAVHFFYVDEEQEAQDLVKEAVPSYDWTFQAFQFKTTCASPY